MSTTAEEPQQPVQGEALTERNIPSDDENGDTDAARQQRVKEMLNENILPPPEAAGAPVAAGTPNDFTTAEQQDAINAYGQLPNNFGVNVGELALERYFVNPATVAPKPGVGAPTVEAKEFLLMSPANVRNEINVTVDTIEEGHVYNSVTAPIGVREPRPELLVHVGMDHAPSVQNKLATALVVADKTAAVYQTPREEFVLWRRWTEVHPNPVVFGMVERGDPDGDVEDSDDDAALFCQMSATTVAVAEQMKKENGAIPRSLLPSGRPASAKFNIPKKNRDPAIYHLRPKGLPDFTNTHQPFVPMFLPSILDDHFFLLGVAAAVAHDRNLLSRVFASLQHIDKGMLTIRMLSEQRVEIPYTGISDVVPQGRSRSARKKRKAATAASLPKPRGATEYAVVTIPQYITIDTMVPVSKTTQETIVPADLDLAVGRTYDAVNEFWLTFLEKAFATLKGSYSALHGGSAPEVLHALVPGQPRYMRWNDQMFYHNRHDSSASDSTATAATASIEPPKEATEKPTTETTQENADNSTPATPSETARVQIDGQERPSRPISGAKPGDKYASAGLAAQRQAGAKKVAEELWWLLQESTLAGQPMILTNTNLCRDSTLDDDCSFGSVPPPIKDYKMHVEEWLNFNWSYGVVVLCAVELDTTQSITDPYLRAIRRRTKRHLNEVKRLVKVRSVYRSNHPDYAKLRGEWSLPHGGGRSADHDERRKAELRDIGELDHTENAEKQPGNITFTEEEEQKLLNGGNDNWSPFAQEFLQYNVQEAVEKQSEDCVWWMTIEEVCRHFNCFCSVLNTSGAGTKVPPNVLAAAASMRAEEINLMRREFDDPFRVRGEGGGLNMSFSGSLRRRKKLDVPVTPLTPPMALIRILRNSLSEDTTNLVSDCITRWANMPESPAPSVACQYYPHFLITVEKAEDMQGGDNGPEVPEGADLHFKTIFDVKPTPVIDLGEETDDENTGTGMSGAATSKTGSAIDIGVNLQNNLQIEVRLSLPRTATDKKDYVVQLYRVVTPGKQQLTKVMKEGKPVMSFPLHTKVNVRGLPPTTVTTSVAFDATIDNANNTTISSSSFAPSSSGEGGPLKAYTFECELTTGNYNLVVLPDPDKTSAARMPINEDIPVQVSVTKRTNAENYVLTFDELK